MKAKPKSFDAYLVALGDTQRLALGRLRKAISAAAPDAEECVAYHLPAFRLKGKFLVAIGAAAKHCAFYSGSASIVKYGPELASYDTSKGTIRFQPEAPLPVSLIRKIVKSRIAEVSQGSVR
jgi:uncharacterized protein YdhG (YjbR/CyaY superfamily)